MALKHDTIILEQILGTFNVRSVVESISSTRSLLNGLDKQNGIIFMHEQNDFRNKANEDD